MSAKLLRAALVTTLAFVSVPLAAPFAAPASAQDVELRIGPDGVRPIIRDRDRDRRDRGCSPREASAPRARKACAAPKSFASPTAA